MNDKLRTDEFGQLIARSLKEGPAHRLPADFAARLAAGLRQTAEPRPSGRPRWMKIAASIAAMATFVAIAAVVGRAVLDTPEPEEPPAPVDPETEMISKGENTMIARKMASLVGAAMVTVAVPAAELTSEPTFVFLRPETSSFWNTATNNTMTVPIDFPAGATSATLSISGIRYNASYPDITGNEFTFVLPEPISQETENVYDLTLTFDNSVTRRAKLGLIKGLSPDSEGTTRCIAPNGSRVWNRVNGRAVLPIPYGTTSFTVNGVPTDTGLDGAQGWYAIGGLTSGNDVSLTLMAGGINYAASLIGGPAGLVIIIK